jgi:hypothetical protein
MRKLVVTSEYQATRDESAGSRGQICKGVAGGCEVVWTVSGLCPADRDRQEIRGRGMRWLNASLCNWGSVPGYARRQDYGVCLIPLQRD